MQYGGNLRNICRGQYCWRNDCNSSYQKGCRILGGIKQVVMKKVHFTCFILLFVFYYSFNAQVKGLYVDKFNLILGNVQKEDSLLNYAQGNGFNYLALYNLWNVHTTSSLTNTVSAQPLANFINKAKTMFGITAVGATGESYWFFSNVIHVYN